MSGRLAGLLALRDGADLGDGLGGHGDDAVGGTDADGTGWPAGERAAPPLAAGGGDGDSRSGARRWPPARERGDHRQDQSHNGEPDPGTQPGGGTSAPGTEPAPSVPSLTG